MKFAVGYRLPYGDSNITDCVIDYKEYVSEVYFPFIGEPSGRSPIGVRDGYVNWNAQHRLESDLRRLKRAGIKLDLIFNANCFGAESLSEALRNRIASVIEHLESIECGVDVVTTASLAVAHMIRTSFPGIEIRASINMRIGTVNAMDCVSDLFDSFYIQREYNRDLERISELKGYCVNNGKRLFFLANSGCLDHCPGQVFHDNLVAHEAEISGRKNITGFLPQVCRRYLKKTENLSAILKACWVRPEDISNYDEYFDMAKLATRQHQNPELVLVAYAKSRYYGTLTDLLEPSYGDILYPNMLINSRIPEDWFSKTSACGKKCKDCKYCESVLQQILIRET